MNLFQKFIIYSFTAALLFPPAVSAVHIFIHQEQPICKNYAEVHFHKKPVDCPLCKLHPNHLLSFHIFNYNVYRTFTIEKKFLNPYQFLSDYQKLSFELRGPPSLPHPLV